jgi:hypothetical protein
MAIVGRGDPTDIVFCGSNGGRLNGWGNHKRALDKVSGVSGWRLHDIRRSVASGLMDLGIARDTISSVLNHSIPGVAGHYLHGPMEALKAAALERWAEHLSRIVSAPPIVQIEFAANQSIRKRVSARAK